jgi:uncharacterized membrane protein YdbT with pleckstrin-like domain
MADSYLKRLLGEHEEILHTAHQHWFLFLRDAAPELALTILGAVLVTQIRTQVVRSSYVALGYIILLIPLAMVIRDYLIWSNHKYVVTSHRVIQLFGVFNKNVTDSSLDKVNDVKLEQSFLGRMFGYGDIQILTASEMGINRFTRIGQPVRFKSAMLNAKQKLEHGEGSSKPTGPSQKALLANLDALHAAGVLSQEEVAAKKAKITGAG